MALRNHLADQGHFLFRWRSYLPVVLGIPLIVAILQMQWPWGSHTVHIYWEGVSFAVSLLGLAVRIWTIGHTPEGTSGRNTAEQIANSLNTTGIYSIVRHPLYLGNFLIGLGPMMLPMVAWLPAVYCLAFALYYERIMMAEEDFLRKKFGAVYDEWTERTPAFLPNWSLYQPASLPFSLRNVLKREYTAIAQITIAFCLIEVMEHCVVEHQWEIEPFWLGVGIFGVLQYLILRSMKRYTPWLHVPGR